MTSEDLVLTVEAAITQFMSTQRKKLSKTDLESLAEQANFVFLSLIIRLAWIVANHLSAVGEPHSSRVVRGSIRALTRNSVQSGSLSAA